MKKVMRNKMVIAMMVVGLVAVFLAAGGVIASPLTGVGDPPVESKVNYQGQLTDSAGNPMNGAYDMEFRFYDSATDGSQVGSNITENDVAVTNGLFNVKLDVNQADFDGQGLWLEVIVEGEMLSPRQEILPVPYALSLKPGAWIDGEEDFGAALTVLNSYNAIYGESKGDGTGLVGVGHDDGNAVKGINIGSGIGVKAYSSSGAAISAEGTGQIRSAADSYIFIPGNEFIKSRDTDTTRWGCWTNGAVQIWRGAATGSKTIYIPITVPGVLYGQEVTVEELTIYYMCQNGTKNYISYTGLTKQVYASGSVLICGDDTDRTSNTSTSYTLSLTQHNVLSSDYGILGLRLSLNFVDDTNYIAIGGARLRLSHH
jgi:hypothetical protein